MPRPPVSPTTTPSGPDMSWMDSTYNANQSGIQQNLNNLKSALLGQGVNLGQNYGVSFDASPTAANPLAATNYRVEDNVDVSNPFSKAGLLKRTYQQSRRGTTNSYAANGQLYSGALGRAQDSNTFNYLQGQDALLKNFQSTYGNLINQYLAGQQAATSQQQQNQNDAINRAIALWQTQFGGS